MSFSAEASTEELEGSRRRPAPNRSGLSAAREIGDLIFFFAVYFLSIFMIEHILRHDQLVIQDKLI